MYDYTNEYSNGGIYFSFFWESGEGRARGHRCGSCDTAPNFECALDAFDATCASSYCATTGTCGVAPLCKQGEYLDTNFVRDGKKTMKCVQCPPGRFGNATNLVSRACSGRCSAGYYCPAGSTSPTEFSCGGANVICRPGSAQPTLVSVGKYSVGPDQLLRVVTVNATNSTALTVDSDPTTRIDEVLCPPGHYCLNGLIFQCPIGRFGNATGLATPLCWAACQPGQVLKITKHHIAWCNLSYIHI